MGALFYLKQGPLVWQGFRKHEAEDPDCLDEFARLLVGQNKGKLLTTLREGIRAYWSEVYDVVNPFGDRRDYSNGSASTPLDLACERALAVDDFSHMTPMPMPAPSSGDFPAPYWGLVVSDISREKSFLGRILQDFGHAWRHLLRHSYNQATFSRLAIATIRISALDFAVVERTGWDQSPGGPYAFVSDLPEWPIPASKFVPAGKFWFVLVQDLKDGLKEIQHHYASMNSGQSASQRQSTTYALLSSRHVVLVRLSGEAGIEWTEPAVLFDGGKPPTSRAIDLLLWMNRCQQQSSSLHSLPVEMQDRILYFTSASTVAAATIGCHLGLGNRFQWNDGGRQLELEDVKRKRSEFSPVESQIYLGPWMSAVSYKPDDTSDDPGSYKRGVTFLT